LGDPVTGFSVKYFTTSGQDITAAVESTGYIGSAVAPGQRIAIRARVEITSAAAHGAVFSRFFQVGETTIYGFFEQDRVGLTLKRK
jgi:hypothetical protein